MSKSCFYSSFIAQMFRCTFLKSKTHILLHLIITLYFVWLSKKHFGYEITELRVLHVVYNLPPLLRKLLD